MLYFALVGELAPRPICAVFLRGLHRFGPLRAVRGGDDKRRRYTAMAAADGGPKVCGIDFRNQLSDRSARSDVSSYRNFLKRRVGKNRDGLHYKHPNLQITVSPARPVCFVPPSSCCRTCAERRKLCKWRRRPRCSGHAYSCRQLARRNPTDIWSAKFICSSIAGDAWPNYLSGQEWCADACTGAQLSLFALLQSSGRLGRRSRNRSSAPSRSCAHLPKPLCVPVRSRPYAWS